MNHFEAIAGSHRLDFKLEPKEGRDETNVDNLSSLHVNLRFVCNCEFSILQKGKEILYT